VSDIGRAEVGAADHTATGYTDRTLGVPLLIFAGSGANSLAVVSENLSHMQTPEKDFPPGLSYKIIYNPIMMLAFTELPMSSHHSTESEMSRTREIDQNLPWAEQPRVAPRRRGSR
jgi:hypothetical protein